MLGSLRNIMKGLSRSMVYNEVMGTQRHSKRGVYCIVVFSFFFQCTTTGSHLQKEKKNLRGGMANLFR